MLMRDAGGVSFCYGKSIINSFLATHVSDNISKRSMINADELRTLT